MNIGNVVHNVLGLISLVLRSDETLGRTIINDVRDLCFCETA